MRMTIPQPQLLKSLQMVERAVNDRSTLPILGNILLEAQDDQLTLTATDLDVGIQCRFPLTQPWERGAVTLPARRLATIVRELPEDTITFEAKKNHTATLSCGASSFRVPGLPAEDFPVLPRAEDAAGIMIPQAALKALITQTSYAMSMEEARFILNGALLSLQKHAATFVATDGRRLAVATTSLSGAAPQPLEAVLPAKTVRELGRLLDASEPDDVSIAPLKDNQLTFRFGGVTVITRLVEGQFPQYDKVIPAPSKTTFTCDRETLLSAVRRANLMTSATSQAVLFELSADQLIVSKESVELGSAREEVPARYDGQPLRVAFNPEFWVDVLKSLDQDQVHVECSGPDRPAVIRIPPAHELASGAQPNFIYLVLPMKVA